MHRDPRILLADNRDFIAIIGFDIVLAALILHGNWHLDDKFDKHAAEAAAERRAMREPMADFHIEMRRLEGRRASGAAATLHPDRKEISRCPTGIGDRRLTVEGRVRGLLVHADRGYEEWGASGSDRLDPGVSGRGLSLARAPVWGTASGGVEPLWAAGPAAGLARDDPFEAKAGLRGNSATACARPSAGACSSLMRSSP